MKTPFLLLILSIFTFTEVAAQNMNNTFTHKVGEYEISLLSELQGLGKTELLIDATADLLQKYAAEGTFSNAVNAFLIKTPKKNILVDTGYGIELFTNLQSLGVEASQIDVILLTHMHGDHIGGLLQEDGALAFPNVKLYLSQAEFDYWTSDKEMYKLAKEKQKAFIASRKVLEAYKDQIQLFQANDIEGEFKEVLPHISPIAAYGHTPGHTMFLVESGKDKLLIWGDLIHAITIQTAEPNVAILYDVDPKMSVLTRKKTLKYIQENKISVAGMHVAYPAMGEIEPGKEAAYLFTPFTETAQPH